MLKIFEISRFMVYFAQVELVLNSPCDDARQVAEEEHDDGRDENYCEVAIPRLLGGSPFA